MSNNFLQTRAISILGGDQTKSASSALRAYVGHLCWGHHLPAVEGEEPDELPSKIFYTIEDRALSANESESTDDRIFINRIRAGMVVHEGVLLKKLAIKIVIALLVLGALAKWINTEGQKHQGVSFFQQEQQQQEALSKPEDVNSMLKQLLK